MDGQVEVSACKSGGGDEGIKNSVRLSTASDDKKTKDEGGEDPIAGTKHTKMTKGMIRSNTPPAGRQRGYSSAVWRDIKRLTPAGCEFLGLDVSTKFTHVCMRQLPSLGGEDSDAEHLEQYCNTPLKLSRKEKGENSTWSVGIGDRHLRKAHPDSQRAQSSNICRPMAKAEQKDALSAQAEW